MKAISGVTPDAMMTRLLGSQTHGADNASCLPCVGLKTNEARDVFCDLLRSSGVMLAYGFSHKLAFHFNHVAENARRAELMLMARL